MLFYSPVNHLNWLNTLNSIEGKQSFVQSKIFIQKSAKKLIRFSLFLIINGMSFNYFTLFFAMFCSLFFTLISLTLKLFIFLAVPWSCVVIVWLYHKCSYGFASLIIIVTGYCYQLRLHQLDLYINLYLKRRKFIRINQQIDKILFDFAEIITGIYQFNKFVSKLIFFILLFNFSFSNLQHDLC